MGDALLTRFAHERDQKVALCRNYANAAAEEGRDLTESEQETIKHARSRITELDTQIELLAGDLEMADETKNKLRMLDPSIASQPTHYRNAGEVLFDLLHQSDSDSQIRFGKAMKRSAEHMGTAKADTIATAGDLGGLIVKPNVGAIVDPYPRGMPLANAIGLIDAPNSLHFMRPRIVDPNFATGVAEQTKQKDELASKAFEVTADPVALATVGGYLNVSQQLISLQPGSLDLIIGHMNRRLANAIERSVAAALLAGIAAGQTVTPASASAADFLKAVYAAAAAYFAQTNELPTWVAAGPLGWAYMGGLSDAAGRPMFPYIGAANANGQANASTFEMSGPAGLRPVVTPAIADNDLYVGGPDSLEAFIYRFPILEAVEPSVLGRQVAVAAAIGAYKPVATAVIKIATV